MFAWRDQFLSNNGGGAANDPYWTNVSLLQNYEYPSSSAIDLSTNSFQPMITGAARPTIRSPFSSGNGGSFKFDTSTAAQIIFPTSTAYNAGSNNFTAECWGYIPAFPGNNTELFAIATNSATSGQATVRIVVTSGGAVYFLCNNSSFGWINTSTTAGGTITAGSWFHYAGVRNGSNFTLYINGVSKLTYTYSGVVGYLTTGTTHLGNLPVGTGFTGASNCYVTNARWVNGTAVYTTGFTPPTTPLTAIANTQLLVTFANIGTMNNNNFVDTSINAAVVTPTNSPKFSGLSPFTNTYPGSINFISASAQYLTSATITPYTYGTGDFTIEGWFRFTTVGVNEYLIDQRNSGSATAVIPTLYMKSTNVIAYYVNGADRITGTTTITTNNWYHIAVSRSGTSTKLFVNGTQNGSTYTDTNIYANSRVVIGSDGSTPGSNTFNGYASNVRLSKGFAYYTSNFSPSTIPLTPDTTYTSYFLAGGGLNDLSNSGQLITQTTFPGTLTTGVAQSNSISTVQKKWGTQSSFYSLSGYQPIVDNSNLQFGTGDFTIEGWVYRNATGLTETIMCKGSSAPTGWLLQINTSNQLIWVSGSTTLKTSSTTISSTTWTYFAITRTGTTGYMFINGTQEGSTFTDNANYNQTNNLNIGADRTNTNGLTGYLDDIRITTGICRYTASFTTPTSAFPTS